jgi:hypothetical protein
MRGRSHELFQKGAFLRTEGRESHRQLPSMLGDTMTQYTVKKLFSTYLARIIHQPKN